MPNTTRLAAILVLLAAVTRPAAARTIARVDGLESGKVQRAEFHVLGAVDIELDGAAAGEGAKALFAYGWLANRTDGRLVWSMVDARPAFADDSRELGYHARLRLEPGDYQLLYFAGRPSQAPGPIDLRRLLRPRATSNREWSITLRVSDGDADAIELALRHPPAGAELRLGPLGNDEHARRRFHVDRATPVEIHAVGEGYPGKPLVDRSWLLNMTTREVVWAMTSKDTQDAGGARKNREQRAELELQPGDYELVAITDDSHSAASWNDLPPIAPDAWGVTLRAAAGSLTDDVAPEHVIVSLSGAEDSERLSARFRVDTAVSVRAYGFGEWSSGAGSLADRGWIEDQRGAQVWAMSYDQSSPGGGASKNRLFDQTVKLTAGEYTVHYVTDDSHARNDWNSGEPFDPAAWGLALSVFGATTPFELLDLTVKAELD